MHISPATELNSKKILLIGSPNSGKTTLYNWMTGAKYRTVNYPGSTVEFTRGQTLTQYGTQYEVYDTPGIRSLDPLSADEQVTVDILNKESNDPNTILMVVVDSTQPERHLLIAHRLISAGYNVFIVLTMPDLIKEKGLSIDLKQLQELMNVPVLSVDGRLGGGVSELIQIVHKYDVQNKKYNPHKIERITEYEVEELYKKITEIVSQCVRPLSNGKNHSALEPTVRQSGQRDLRQGLQRADPRSLKIDSVIMHPIWGLVIFFIIMSLLFTSIFWAAQPVMDFIDETFGGMAEGLYEFGGHALWADFLGNGIVAGVGSVLVFLPQIVILFLVMVLLEDSGYLARAATLVDKPLSLLGLNGRSFVPLLSGYACAIPAMMAARTIPNRRERLLTLLIIPLMSCSARLPVWALLLGLLFPDQPFWAGIGLTLIYFMSLFVGAIVATFASKFLKKEGRSWFMMELPAYRKPHIRFVLKTVFARSYSYLKKAGPAIVIISVSIWLLSTFPNYKTEDGNERLNSSYLATLGQLMDPIMKPMGGDWRLGVGILAAFAAREVFVSTTAIVFRVSDADGEVTDSLLEALRGATHSDGTLIFTISTVLGLILYFIIALQCLPTVAVSKTESGSIKFAMLQLFSFVIGAYVLSVALVQTLRLIGIP